MNPQAGDRSDPILRAELDSAGSLIWEGERGEGGGAAVREHFDRTAVHKDAQLKLVPVHGSGAVALLSGVALPAIDHHSPCKIVIIDVRVLAALRLVNLQAYAIGGGSSYVQF